MEHESVQLNLGLRDEQLNSLNFYSSDSTPLEPNIYSKSKIEIIEKYKIKIITNFNFEDLGFVIKGEIERSIDIQMIGSEEAKEYFNVYEFVEKEKEELLMPIASKISKIIAGITDDAYIFPLLVPPTEWISSENSKIEILENDE